MQYIRQGATHKVVLGPAVAVGDGFTPVTTLALSSADEAEAILHDNGTVVDISGYTWAAITTADGYYHLTLQSGISNTVGHLTIVVNDDSLCLPLRADFCVIEEAVYDALFAASANAWSGAAGSSIGVANMTQLGGDAQSATDLKDFADAGYDPGTNKVQGVVLVDTLTTYTSNTPQSGDAFARLGAPAGASVSADVAAVKVDTAAILVDTAEIGAAGAGLTEAGGTGDHLTALATAANLSALETRLRGLVMHQGTLGATGNDTTHLHLDGLTQGNDELNDYLIVIFDNSASEYHARWIEDWVLSTELATVATLPFTPEASTDTYWLMPVRQDVSGGSGLDAAGVRAAVGLASANLDTQLGTIVADTNELQTDWANGGRLDLLLDAAKENTDYPGDYVYWNSASGSSGTTVGTNGTARNPSDTFANAANIANARDTGAIRLSPSYAGESISTGNFINYTIDMNGGTLKLADAVTANGFTFKSTGGKGRLMRDDDGPVEITNSYVENCQLNGATIAITKAYFRDCEFHGDVTINDWNDTDPVIMTNCYNGLSDTPIVFDLTTSGAPVVLQGWWGDLEVENLGAGQVFECYGWAKLTINANCTGGTIKHTSHVEIVDNASGAVTTELISEAGAVSSFTTAAKAELQQEATDALNAYDPPTNAEMEARTLVAANYFDPAADTVANVTTVGSVTTKTGYALASTGLDLVTAWTVAITGNITGNLSGSVGSVTGAVGSVTGNVGGNVTGSVGSLATQAKADVNTEVLDVLNTDTFAEPTGVPAATSTLATKIGYLFMALRNKLTLTSTKKTFYDDSDNAEWEKDVSDDGTTYSESEGNAP